MRKRKSLSVITCTVLVMFIISNCSPSPIPTPLPTSTPVPTVTPSPPSSTLVPPKFTPTLVPPSAASTATLVPSTPTSTLKPIAQRIGNRAFPSIFQAWNKADNLPSEDPDRTVARHDLVWYNEAQIGLRWDATFTGLATGFTPSSLAVARSKRDKLLNYNPNMVLLAEVRYRDAPSTWLPSDHLWWKHDASGNRVAGWAEGGYYVLDWHNPSYRTQVATQAKAFIDSGVFDGIMLDWWEDDDPDRISMLKEVRNAIGNDKLIIVNSNANQTPNSATYINGLFMESCFLSPKQQACLAPNTPKDWQKIADTLLWAESNLRSPQINAVETWYADSRNDLNRMRATTALVATHSNGFALFSDPNPLPSPDHLHNWYSFWDQKTLGKPISTMLKRQDGAFQREFEGGTVVYNPMGNSTITIVFTDARSSVSTGKTATTFTLEAMDGDLYLKPR